MVTQTLIKLIYDTARAQGAHKEFAMILCAQARHETGNFTNNASKDVDRARNLFGMKKPSVRSSVQPIYVNAVANPPGREGPTPYAGYASYADSVRDMFFWFKAQRFQYFDIMDTATYAKRLKAKGYYGDPESVYANGLAKHFKTVVNSDLKGVITTNHETATVTATKPKANTGVDLSPFGWFKELPLLWRKGLLWLLIAAMAVASYLTYKKRKRKYKRYG